MQQAAKVLIESGVMKAEPADYKTLIDTSFIQ